MLDLVGKSALEDDLVPLSQVLEPGSEALPRLLGIQSGGDELQHLDQPVIVVDPDDDGEEEEEDLALARTFLGRPAAFLLARAFLGAGPFLGAPLCFFLAGPFLRTAVAFCCCCCCLEPLLLVTPALSSAACAGLSSSASFPPRRACRA